jgi:hypothetical protein
MPHITIKTEYVQKLKELGVYDQWLGNIKTQWNERAKIRFSEMQQNTYSWAHLISQSFVWSSSNEGLKFWHDTSKM